MGSGTYCSATRTVRAEASGFYTKALEEVFPSTQLNNAMLKFENQEIQSNTQIPLQSC